MSRVTQFRSLGNDLGSLPSFRLLFILSTCVFRRVCVHLCVCVYVCVYAFARSRHWKHLALQTGFKGSNELRSQANWDRCKRACISVGTSLLHDDRCNTRMFRRFTSANSFKPEVEEILCERKGSRGKKESKEEKKIIHRSIGVSEVIFLNITSN